MGSLHQWRLRIIDLELNEEINLSQPKFVSRADPFIIVDKKKIFIFFEEFNVFKRHGYIVVGIYDRKQKKMLKTKKILKKDYHISFPFTFKIKNKYYMIPETSENDSLELYKFNEFPYKLELKKLLLKGVKVSDSVYFENSKFKAILTTLATRDDPKMISNLICIPVQNLLNSKIEFKNNRVLKRGVEHSRMAGAITKINGKQYRFSQDCKTRYGHRINIHEVIVKNGYFFEKKIKTLNPRENEIAIHSLNIANNLVVTDYKIVCKSPIVRLVYGMILFYKRIFS